MLPSPSSPAFSTSPRWYSAVPGSPRPSSGAGGSRRGPPRPPECSSSGSPW